jgi:hypothetical protein
MASTLPPGTIVELATPVVGGQLYADVRVVRWAPHSKMLIVANPVRLALRQRRNAFRVPVAVPIELCFGRDDQLHIVRGTTRDLSPLGFSADVEDAPMGRERVLVRLDLAPSPIVTLALVLGREDPPGLPLRARFVAARPADRDRIARFLRRVEMRKAKVAS